MSPRRCLQLLVVLYVTLYQLWYAQGYQEFSTVESSTTTKVSIASSAVKQSIGFTIGFYKHGEGPY